VPVTSFTVTTQSCAGGTQTPIVNDLEGLLDGSDPGSGPLNLPPISLNPGCNPAPSALPSVFNASNTESGSASGSASISSEALGNAVLAEQAYGGVVLSAPVPLPAPASSVDLSVPYTTSGITWTALAKNDQVGANLVIEFSGPIKCADGSDGTESPRVFTTPPTIPTPPGSGTLDFQIFCPDGSQLVSAGSMFVTVDTSVYAVSGRTESASAGVELNGVSATINS
jgi:hypothetical protein